MELNKKGIFFTFAAIALAIIILLSYSVHTEYRLKDKMEVIETRVDTMSNFVKNLEKDAENAIFIAGFRSLLSLEDYMMKYNQFMAQGGSPNLANGFKDLFRFGTITTGAETETMSLMKNNTFLNWTKRMEARANRIGIEIEFTVNSVTITQSEPWMVDVRVNLDIDVQDIKSTASWKIDNKDYTKKINITGFVDPLYLVKTNGVANNTIRETPYSSWPAGLSAHLTNAYYREHTDAPNYLMRFENNLASNSNGIESLVTQKLKDKGLPVSSKSAVDYIYFGSTSPPSCSVVDIADTDFRLDDPAHTGFYGTSCV